MITAVDARVAAVETVATNVATTVDATNLALKSNIDSLADLNRGTEELRRTTASEIGAAGWITAIEQETFRFI